MALFSALAFVASSLVALIAVVPASATSNPQRAAVQPSGQASWTATSVSVGLYGNSGTPLGHSCAVTSTNGVKCWGNNGDSQMGLGSNTTNSTYPVNVLLTAGGTGAQVSSRSAVKRPLSASADHTCVIYDTTGSPTLGGVLCWGRNNSGQLGNNTTANSTGPVIVLTAAATPLTGAVAIVTGDDNNMSNGHTCAVISDGSVRCWGYNAEGELGDGTTVAKSVATLVPTIAGATDVSAGEHSTCAVITAGGVRCWGYHDANGESGDNSVVVSNRLWPAAVVAARSRKLADVAIPANGSTITSALAAFTSADVGLPVTGSARFTAGTTISSVTNATTVVLSNPLFAGSGQTNQTAVFGGKGVNDGAVPASGSTITSATAAFTSADVGLAVTGQRIPAGATISSITNATTVVLSASLSAGSALTAQPLSFGPLFTGASTVATGTATNCVVTSPGASGSIYCWGWGNNGQVGLGNTNAPNPSPFVVPGSTGATAVTVGDQHTCGVIAGAAWCWGLNDFGEVGDGSLTTRTSPVQVIAPGQVAGGTKLTGVSTAQIGAISAGARVVCATLATGAVTCWGHGTLGETGDGNAANTAAGPPVYVNGAGPATWNSASVSVGGTRDNQKDHSCVVTSVGGVKCWGFGTSGQMGNGSTTANNPAPVDAILSSAAGANPVARVNVTNGQNIASTQAHTCVIFDVPGGVTGGVQCWGAGGTGALGDGKSTSSSLPVIVQNPGNTGPLTGATAISAGGQDEGNTTNETCAIATNGANSNAALCWGYAADGRIGDAGTTNRSIPTQVSGLTSGVKSITAGSSFACAVNSSSQAMCWGYNGYGVLGLNNSGSGTHSTPSAVLGTGGTGNLGSLTSIYGSGNDHVCAMSSTGGVYCWGNGTSGDIGDAGTTQRNLPVVVQQVGGGAALANVVSLSVGDNFNCAVQSTGRAVCWGENGDGQLGNGDTADKSTPVMVIDTAEVKSSTTFLGGIATNTWGSISSGSYSTCAQIPGAGSTAANPTGSVTCWGFEGAQGELGHGTIPNVNPSSMTVSCTPTVVVTAATVTCTASVTDTAATGKTAATGTVNFSTVATGANPAATNTCTLSGGPPTASCTATFTSANAGSYTVSGIIATNAAHIGSSGVSSTVTVTSTKLAVTGPASCTAAGGYISTLKGFNAAAIYQLNDASGLTATDSSGNGRNADVTSSGVTYANKPGPTRACDTTSALGAMGFDGSTGRAQAPTSVTTTGSALTVMTWFKATNLASSANPRLLGNAHTDTDKVGFQLMFNSGGGTGFFDVGNATATADVRAGWTKTLVNNQWYFYVGTFNGTTATAYIDGVNVGSQTVAATTITAPGTPRVSIGAAADGGDKFTGQMADAAILPTALTQAQIQSLYTIGSQTFPATTALPTVRVQAQNAAGVAITTAGIPVTLTVNGGATLASGTTSGVTGAGGFIDFTDLVINSVGTGYSFTATAGTTAVAGTGPTFNTTFGAASQLAFTTQPVGGASGAALGTQPVVKVEDAAGNVVTSSTQAVTLTSSGGTLASCAANPVTAIAGVATFSGCTFSGTLGTDYQLLAAASGPSISGTSNTFQVSGPGTATQLVITQQPVAGVSGAVLTTQPKVTVRDSAGNAVTGSAQVVSLSIAGSSSPTLTGCTPSLTAGVTTFSGCTVTGLVGVDYTLTASATSPTLTSAPSSTFQLVNRAPTTTAITGTTVRLGQTVAFNLSATDLDRYTSAIFAGAGGNETPTITLTQPAEGTVSCGGSPVFTATSATVGSFACTYAVPTSATVGSNYTFTYTVTDSHSGSNVSTVSGSISRRLAPVGTLSCKNGPSGTVITTVATGFRSWCSVGFTDVSGATAGPYATGAVTADTPMAPSVSSAVIASTTGGADFFASDGSLLSSSSCTPTVSGAAVSCSFSSPVVFRSAATQTLSVPGLAQDDSHVASAPATDALTVTESCTPLVFDGQTQVAPTGTYQNNGAFNFYAYNLGCAGTPYQQFGYAYDAGPDADLGNAHGFLTEIVNPAVGADRFASWNPSVDIDPGTSISFRFFTKDTAQTLGSYVTLSDLTPTAHTRWLSDPYAITIDGVLAPPTGKSPQTITFPAFTSVRGTTVPLLATTSSPLTVTYAISAGSPAACSLSGNSVVFTTTIGATCTIVASQSGGSAYLPASSVSRSVKVVGVGQTITFHPPAGPFLVGNSIEMTSDVVSASSNLAVTLVASGGCSGTTTITFNSTASCKIKASQGGNSVYAPASDATWSLTPFGQVQTITFGGPAGPFVVGDPAVVLDAPTSNSLATTGLPVTLVASGCQLSGTTVTFNASGTCKVTASQAATSVWAKATPVVWSVKVLGKTQAITFGGPAGPFVVGDPAVVLDAPTSNSLATTGLPVTLVASGCTLTGYTVTFGAKGTCKVTASQAATSEWAKATSVVWSVKVAGQAQTLTFPALATPSHVGAELDLSGATTTSPLAVTFTTSGPCSVSDQTLHLSGTGSCKVTAAQIGDPTWAAAKAVTRTVVVIA